MMFVKSVKMFSWALVAAATLVASTSSAQYFPTFGASVSNPIATGSGPEGIAIASVPGRTQAAVVLAVVNLSGAIRTFISYNGASYSSALDVPTTVPEYCDAVSHANHCNPAIANVNGTPYIAFRDTNSNLEIFKGTLDAADDYYSWTHVTTLATGYGAMSTSPQITYAFGKIMIIYGVNLPNDKNALVNTSSADGVTWTSTDAGLGALTYSAPTQVGLSIFGSKLYMVTQQNNSDRRLFYWSTPDGVNWTGAEFSSLAVDSGLSMVTYNNNLVFSTKQNNSQDHLFLFSSPNGSTWYAQQNTPLVSEYATPSMTLFNGGIALAYLDNSNSNNVFYGAFASH